MSTEKSEDYSEASLDLAQCSLCGECLNACKLDAIETDLQLASIDPRLCVNCGDCYEECPNEAVIPT
ncbi:4Fe-4S binding protein [Gemmatimonadota bacterium]